MKKKHIKIAAAVVLLVVAGGIFWLQSGGSASAGIEEFRGETVLLQCPKCSQRTEMDKAEYLQTIQQEHSNLEGSLPCSSCGSGLVEMMTCPKCKNVFRKSAFPQDFADRCPQCRHSEIEQSRNG